MFARGKGWTVVPVVPAFGNRFPEPHRVTRVSKGHHFPEVIRFSLLRDFRRLVSLHAPACPGPGWPRRQA